MRRVVAAFAILSCSTAIHIRPLRQVSAPKNNSGAPALRRKRDTIALALRRVSAPITSALSSALSAAALAAISLFTVGALTITPPDKKMAPFAWHLFWRRVTRPEAAQAEARLLDLGLGAGRWRRSDTAASSAPDDYVHSVSIDGTGDTVRSPTLVMVHGLANGGGIFTRNLRPLSAAFAKIHAVDWRGAGLSGRPTYKPDDHDSARDFLVDGLEKWRESQGVDRMVLLGHSMGGLISAHYASRYPERVDHLVLVGPAAVQARPRRIQPGESKMYDLAEQLWKDGYTPSGFLNFLGPWGKRLVERYAVRRYGLADEEYNEALADYIYAIQSLGIGSAASMNQLLAPIAQPKVPIAPIVEKLPMPVTYIYGEHDWMDPRSGVASAARCRVDGVARVLPGGGHYIFIDQPELFENALLDRVAPGTPHRVAVRHPTPVGARSDRAATARHGRA
jgi:abhydrolase domain-containing protein 5